LEKLIVGKGYPLLENQTSGADGGFDLWVISRKCTVDVSQIVDFHLVMTSMIKY
jgi:hypothetical protein